jgi:hypothetical protein
MAGHFGIFGFGQINAVGGGLFLTCEVPDVGVEVSKANLPVCHGFKKGWLAEPQRTRGA